MAVYTRLKFDEISSHLKNNYNIGELTEFSEIIAGIDNSNFVIKTTLGKFILTIFEKRIKVEELPFFIDFKIHLAKNEICCPRPILSINNESLVDLKSKKSTIATFLSGKSIEPKQNSYYDNITIKHCQEVAEMLAKLHLAAQDFDKVRENDLGHDGFEPLFDKFKDLLNGYQVGLKSEIADSINYIKNNWRNDLRKSTCHLDLFADNVFFDENDKVSGVIDFYFAANDLQIYDFAILVNAWCFDGNNEFVDEKFDEMKKSYQKIRKFTDCELDFLKIALYASSARFLLTRLNDMFFTPQNSVVNIKDPQEYLQKLRYFRKFL